MSNSKFGVHICSRSGRKRERGRFRVSEEGAKEGTACEQRGAAQLGALSKQGEPTIAPSTLARPAPRDR